MSGSAPAPEQGAHCFELRVYYEDTDFGGVVYYANYLKFIERARTEWLRALGVDQTRLKAQAGLVFVVRRCAVEFRRPARLDDLLTVRTRLIKARGASLELAQAVHLTERPGEEGAASAAPLVAAEVLIACIDPDGRPARLPAALTARLAG